MKTSTGGNDGLGGETAGAAKGDVPRGGRVGGGSSGSNLSDGGEAGIWGNGYCGRGGGIGNGADDVGESGGEDGVSDATAG